MAVLVLNMTYEPLTLAREPRALALIGRGRAEALAHGPNPIRTSSSEIPRPSVIRLMEFVRRPRPRVRFSRQNILKRDGHECQYCGARPHNLTIDHVMPASRGGQDTWENTVAACVRCNHKKGARTPQEAHMTLRTVPVEPKITGWLHLGIAALLPEWEPYFPA